MHKFFSKLESLLQFMSKSCRPRMYKLEQSPFKLLLLLWWWWYPPSENIMAGNFYPKPAEPLQCQDYKVCFYFLFLVTVAQLMRLQRLLWKKRELHTRLLVLTSLQRYLIFHNFDNSGVLVTERFCPNCLGQFCGLQNQLPNACHLIFFVHF